LISASDYAILVRNVPKDMPKAQVESLFREQLEGTCIEYVNIAYDIGELIEIIRVHDSKLTEKLYIESSRA